MLAVATGCAGTEAAVSSADAAATATQSESSPGRRRSLVLRNHIELEIKPKPAGAAQDPRMLNFSTVGGSAPGTISVRNGSGDVATGGTSLSTGVIPQRRDPTVEFQDSFAVDVAKGVYLRFDSDTLAASIQLTYWYE